MRAIANWEEVPIFDSEEAEAEFWVENKPDLRLMEGSLAGNSEARARAAISDVKMRWNMRGPPEYMSRGLDA